MGLDMYLYRKTYVKNWGWTKPEFKYDIKITRGDKSISVDNIVYVVEEVAYWRKANAIHQWFVDNCQEGVDDCKEYYVDKEKLETLVDLCNQIIKNPLAASKILPTTSGFFFGSTDYDEYYMHDLKITVEQLTPLLSQEGDYYYHSSW